MGLCKELEEGPEPFPKRKRQWTLADQVEAMDWDLTGLKGRTDSLERSRWRYRVAMLLVAVIMWWRW